MCFFIQPKNKAGKVIMPILIILSLYLFYQPISFANAIKDEIRIHQSMTRINNLFNPLILTSIHCNQTNNCEENKKIINNLLSISASLKELQPLALFQKPTIKQNLVLANIQLKNTISLIKSNNVLIANTQLKKIGNICISCHNQLSSPPVKILHNSFLTNKQTKFHSDYDFANYLYIIRQYDNSIIYYKRSIDFLLSKISIDKNSKNENEEINFQLLDSFKKILSIHTRLNLSPYQGIQFLRMYQNDKRLNRSIRIKIFNWEKSLSFWINENPYQLYSTDEFLKKYLSQYELFPSELQTDEADINLLVASGILSKYLINHSTDEESSKILYWLAVIERKLEYSYLYSLSELYLRDCIIHYSKYPYAKKCLDKYENDIIFDYTGSSGLDIPGEYQQELKKFNYKIQHIRK